MAAALALSGLAGNAHALGFGRLNVQSALGQPLRAEVELTDVRGEGLKAGLAPASVYSQKGVEYHPAVKTIHSSIRHLPNGRAVLVLSSTAPINDPFVDVVLQASDASGSVTRDFSILLDPPAYVKAPAPVVAPVIPAPTLATGAVPREPVLLPPPQEDTIVVEPARTPRKASTRTARRASTRTTARATAGSVRVRTGHTASQIAAANRPARVSLDQMMVAMLHANPHAFINGNVNYLKSGVTLRVPTADEARAVSASEARTMIVAQAEDFRNYRGRLARAPMAQATPSAQQSGGKVQTQVEDKSTAPSKAPDTLTISKPQVAGNKPTEERMAEALQKKDNTNRADELNKNLNDLKNISAEAAASAQAAGKAGTSSAPIVLPPVPGMTTSAAASQPTAPASTPEELAAKAMAEAASAAATATSAAASATADMATQAIAAATGAASKPPVKTPPVTRPAPPPVEEEEPGFLASLLGNPMMLGGLGLALIGGLGYVAMKRRRQARDADDASSSFLESGLNPDSFFNASGGKDVDTSESSTAGHASTDLNQSSMLYSPSQLDAEADVDPVSEADVYLAYGRDIQAEEILKDALLKQPNRIPVHAKLLEIYARRRDVKAYAQGAATLKQLTNGVGPEWDLVRAKGAEIDPGNPMFGGVPAAAAPAVPPPPSAPNPAVVAGAAAGAAAATQVVAATAAPQAPTINRELLNEPNVAPATMPATPTALHVQASQPVDVPMDISLDMPELDAAPAEYAPVAPQAAPDAGGMDFDMSGLSLDLDASPAPAASATDPLATKLALAREFISIGDTEGARTMAAEVAQHASGELKAQAEALLASIQ
ncbi:MAG: FimV/HubP family polar landmark protein [Brachymonas sp.]|nr:FimV/HubP family polar landmark protein [Brachymonas sp.]